MKISFQWLKQYCPVALSAEELAERLLLAGFPTESITAAGDDAILDVEVTSNRPDLLGHLGMAREVSALTGTPFTAPKAQPAGEPSDALKAKTSVAVQAPDACPLYTARIIEDVKVGPSPGWLARQLEAVGLRPVNNVVDITNFVLLEYSQPLHAFDHDKLRGGRIVVRMARQDEKIVSIDGHLRDLDRSMLVIADEAVPVAVAGVMGGLETEVSAATQTVLLESAYFAPLSIRSTARKLAMFSDSSYRFERGVDVGGVTEASNRATDLIVEVCGGRALGGVAVGGQLAPHTPTVALRIDRVGELLGMDVPADRIVRIFEGLGLSPQLQGRSVTVTVPSFRQDLRREVDLVEEAARIEGYDRIPVRDRIEIVVRPPGGQAAGMARIGLALAGMGFHETVSFTFLPADQAELFAWGGGGHLEVAHPSRRQENALRRSLLPSLLLARQRNQAAQAGRAALFEIAVAFDPPSTEGDLPHESLRLGLCTDGDFAHCRNVIEQLVGQLDPQARIGVQPADRTEFQSGCAARVLLDGRQIGWIGQLSGELQSRFDLAKPVLLAELETQPLVGLTLRPRRFQPISRFPAIERDLCVFVDEATPWEQVESAIRRADVAELEAVELMDLFRGRHVPAGKKSLTLTLRYRRADGTLTNEDANRFVATALAALQSRLGAVLREQ